ncbi:MAG: recombination regulator RecX [Clostridium sp.]|nr:recombination regulator RecX [Clostridium sp.]MCI7441941.1 recombination regulator RecX [Clostridium sp.]
MGTITEISVQKKNKNRCNIYIDNVFAFGVSNELIYKENLKIGMIIDEEKLKKIAYEENLINCKETALKIIERSYKTKKEMIKRLLEKGYALEEINETLKFLEEYNFINDESYAKAFINDRTKTQGKQKIKYALKNKGVSDEIIEEELSKLDMEKEKENANILALKKYSILIKRESDKYKLKEKIIRFLISRGYDYEVAKDAVNETLKSVM